ncbi:hypothetical protein [Alteromonas gilva]|uniref:Uncharacterized protein n=1 Tax=Alteromonas gilva TaxID=2987522 RepID=A0ABT5L7R5_9ALTE|nr:hypothetical protein [Alteromonas gilva]MDC8832922.1 hypothetical protein [Alteromonas gilva]
MKKKLSDVVLLLMEVLLLAFGTSLFPGGLFSLVFGAGLSPAQFSFAVVALVVGFFMILTGAVLAVVRFVKYTNTR